MLCGTYETRRSAMQARIPARSLIVYPAETPSTSHTLISRGHIYVIHLIHVIHVIHPHPLVRKYHAQRNVPTPESTRVGNANDCGEYEYEVQSSTSAIAYKWYIRMFFGESSTGIMPPCGVTAKSMISVFFVCVFWDLASRPY